MKAIPEFQSKINPFEYKSIGYREMSQSAIMILTGANQNASRKCQNKSYSDRDLHEFSRI